MAQRTYSLFLAQNFRLSACHLFGYSSRGVPGLKLLGFPKKKIDILKEKIVFLLRLKSIKLPMKSYHINFEIMNDCETKDIEASALFMLLCMGEVFKMRDIDRCFVCGEFDFSGNFYLSAKLKKTLENESELINKSQKTLITPSFIEGVKNQIPINDLIGI